MYTAMQLKQINFKVERISESRGFPVSWISYFLWQENRFAKNQEGIRREEDKESGHRRY
jgi:hypothetical protein